MPQDSGDVSGMWCDVTRQTYKGKSLPHRWIQMDTVWNTSSSLKHLVENCKYKTYNHEVKIVPYFERKFIVMLGRVVMESYPMRHLHHVEVQWMARLWSWRQWWKAFLSSLYSMWFWWLRFRRQNPKIWNQRLTCFSAML